MQNRVTKGQDVVKSAREEIEKRHGKTPEQLFEEREKRFTDVIQLKVPDRMPVYIRGGYFPIHYAGVSPSAIYYDPAAYQKAIVKTILDFEPDIFPQISRYSGLALEKLGTIQYKWPGGNLKSDQHSQYVDAENMSADEYDLFMTSPDDFILRHYLPRAFKALEPFAKLPPMRSLLGQTTLVPQLPRLISPEIVQAFEALFQAGQAEAEFEQWRLDLSDDLGVPPLNYPGGDCVTPFDVITDYLRGMNGTAVDMVKQPEKLLAAMERLLEWHLARMVPPSPEEKGRRVSGTMAHWGSEAFLSRKQFYTFYWPTIKKSLLAAIDMGFVPVMVPEVKMDDRLECFLELPKGKALVFNVFPDPVRAKEILGGHIAIMGGMPTSLLWGGSPQEVEEYCKNVIEVCGKGGGFILACRGFEDDANPANVKAMVNAIRKYGRY